MLRDYVEIKKSKPPRGCKMGLGQSAIKYEGYGRDKESALSALDALCRYHHDEASVRREARQPAGLEYDYYLWDGARAHTIYFDMSRRHCRAFIHFG